MNSPPGNAPRGGPPAARRAQAGPVAGRKGPTGHTGTAAGRAAVDAGEALGTVGLRQGDAVRWQPTAGGRWKLGRATRLERDGSVGVTDERGMARSLPVDRLEVRSSGRRGGERWEPLAERARTAEQLRLV